MVGCVHFCSSLKGYGTDASSGKPEVVVCVSNLSYLLQFSLLMQVQFSKRWNLFLLNLLKVETWFCSAWSKAFGKLNVFSMHRVPQWIMFLGTMGMVLMIYMLIVVTSFTGLTS